MQIVSELIRADEAQRMGGIAQRIIEIDYAIESVTFADPGVDLVPHLLARRSLVANQPNPCGTTSIVRRASRVAPFHP